ncbi:MAG: WYL domain-containing protein [Clostridia bacterium]|nr:WYL domain-containing protein [Clostridia bacterium]
MAGAKLKTLLVFKYLDEYSDENNPLSTVQLIEMLSNEGIKCERKSIYADVKTLKEIGYDIMSVKSPKRGFFMASRKFEIPEVRLLIDAVTSAGFITPKKTQSLVEKLESLVSKNQANSIVTQVYIDPSTKCDNEEIYYIIDTLHKAVQDRKKVKFLYKRRNIDVENKKNYTERTFTVSPYALIWKDDHYYLICNNQKYNNIMNLRVDRIRKVNTLDEPARPVGEVSEYKTSFDVADYSKKMFNMYSGKSDKIRIACELDLREQIMDRFGAKVPLSAYDSSHFETTVDVVVSDGLIAWLMSFGKKVKVIEPQYLADAVKHRAEQIANLYK